MGSTGISTSVSSELTAAGITMNRTTGYEYKDGALYRNAVAGQFLDSRRPTRNAGNYKIFVDSFPGAALPYSVYRVADTTTGAVYTTEVTHGGRNILKEMTDELKER